MGIKITRKMAQMLKEQAVEVVARPRITGMQMSTGGSREDINGIYFRSTMEANMARVWQWMKLNGPLLEWEYEPQEFSFPVKRGTRTYKPDFRLTYKMPTIIVCALDGNVRRWQTTICWVETKGYMDKVSKIKLRRFMKYYPNEPLRIITAEEYKTFIRQFKGLIETWE